MEKMIEVALTEYEMDLAAQVGTRRHIAALYNGKKDSHGFDGDGWGIHIEGAAGEMAFAKAKGRYWDGSVNTFKLKGDVGNVQVRTAGQHDFHLIIRPDDKDEDNFVLVTGHAPNFRVVGWIGGKEGKEKGKLSTVGGRAKAYFVAGSDLKPIE